MDKLTGKKYRLYRRILSIALSIAVLFTSLGLEGLARSVEASTTYTTIYLKDDTAQHWIGNDNAVIELVDNTEGHEHYIMHKDDGTTWSGRVPSTTYNVTFNRLSPDKSTQWNSWSAGGRDSNNVYFADGGEYGHWEVMEDDNEEKYFHAGDIVYLDLTQFAAWKSSDALLYINFTGASKKENNGQDINLSKADKSQYNPKKVDMEVTENIYAYVVGFEDEGSTELRFWRGNNSTLWNCSIVLSYDDYVNGVNCVKVKNWDDNGILIISENNMDIIIDSDDDGITDYYESIAGTNRFNKDSDGDGLTDYQEIFFTKSNPLIYDSLVSGISDADVDNDADGLNNGIEMEIGTNPNKYDSDEDGLSDYEEINVYLTDPNNADTDGDTLNDGDEIKLKFSPLLKDTDDNGILDCDEKTFQNLEINISNEDRQDISKVSVEFNGTGYINSTTEIEDLYGKDKYISDTVGLVGVPVDINSSSKFDNAKITFFMNKSYSSEMLKKLIVLWYDEKNDRFVEQETHYDEMNMSVSTEVNHFSKYMIVDKEEWFEAWHNEIEYPNDNKKNFDTIISIDCSGSMRTNDPNFEYSVKNTLYPGSSYQITTCYRKLASKNYVKAQGKDDQTGIVLFTSNANAVCGLTNSEYDLMNAIDKIYSSGGTDFNNAINESIRILTNARNDSEKRILLVSDGEAEVSSSMINLAIEKNIKINTVYIGGQNNNALLKNIADQTGGKYFKAVTADELINIYSEIMVDQKIDSTDSDKDGIPDVFEISGMRLSNGTIIYTDPFNADTDGDGLLDGEEIGVMPTFWLNIIFDKFDIPSEIGAYIFEMKSNPNIKDTDGDGLDDKIDNEPCNSKVHEFLIYETDATDYKAKNCELENRPEDFKYADLSKNELIDLSWINWTDFFGVSKNDYINSWKLLVWTLSKGKMVDVGMDMIDHFLDGTGSDYYNEDLIDKIKNHDNSKSYVKKVNEILVNILNENNGNVSELQYRDSDRDNSIMVNRMNGVIYNPYFNDKTNGLGICVDGIYGAKIEMTSFKYNKDKNQYEYTLKFTYYDIYGLDYSDLTDGYGYGTSFGILFGFRSWYILQHWSKYNGDCQPFFNYMTFEESFVEYVK